MVYAINDVLENMFDHFGNTVFHQIVGIPMGTNNDPLIAYCFDTFVKTIYPMEEKLEDTKKSQYYKQPVSICRLRYTMYYFLTVNSKLSFTTRDDFPFTIVNFPF